MHSLVRSFSEHHTKEHPNEPTILLFISKTQQLLGIEHKSSVHLGKTDEHMSNAGVTIGFK